MVKWVHQRIKETKVERRYIREATAINTTQSGNSEQSKTEHMGIFSRYEPDIRAFDFR